jgi:hypothetical protein
MDFKIDTKINEEVGTTDVCVTLSNGKTHSTTIKNRKYEIETKCAIARAVFEILKDECGYLLEEKGYKLSHVGRQGNGKMSEEEKEKHRKIALASYYRRKSQKSQSAT